MLTTPITYDLWSHQIEHVVEHALKPEWAQLWEPRTGKTLASLRGAVRWINEAKVYHILIVAPKTVCADVWFPQVKEELGAKGFLHEAKVLEVVPLYVGSLKARADHLRWLIVRGKERTTCGLDPIVEVALINYDALDGLADVLLKWGVDAIVFDEAHRVKSASANRSRAAYRLARQARFRRALTGTVAPNGLIDIYGVWKVLSPSTFGTNKAAFMERYCIVNPFYPSKVEMYKNTDELQQKAFAIASVKLRKDCFDIPPERDEVVEIELPKHVRKIYDKIVNDHVLELKRGDETEEILMTHTLSRLLQLRQICIGYSRHEVDGERQVTWLHKEKIDYVKAWAEDIVEGGGKVAIFHKFRPEGAAMVQALKAYHPQVLNGDIKGDDRPGMIARFRHDPNYNVMIAQETVASLGISFREADYTSFLSTGDNHDDHKQARDRTFAPLEEMPHKKLVHGYPRIAKSVEVTLYHMLKRKAKLEELLMTGKLSDSFRAAAYGEL
jgi:SNF2 family DNA or RNA helicase